MSCSSIGSDGTFTSIDVAFTTPRDAERVQGPLIPGMPNLHSHAFQRALAGLTQRGGPAADNFWTWRTEMYRFLERVGPVEQEAIAAQLYLEMLKAGYTSVAEFHYLHHDPAGRPYADPAEMAMRIVAAAAAAGIGLTLLPVFYAHSQLRPAPRRHRPAPLHPRARELLRSDAKAVRRMIELRLGVAPHSLRAVTPEELQAVVALGDDGLVDGPIHIHAAEQRKEVDDCVAWSGARPVRMAARSCRHRRALVSDPRDPHGG